MPRSKIPLVLVGAGGHAKVLADLIAAAGVYRVVGATDAQPKGPAAKLSGLPILGGDEVLPGLKKKGVSCASVGVGASTDTRVRAFLRRLLRENGFTTPALIHPRAIVSERARIEPGAQVMAGAVINPGARVGAGAVINTGAIVEHDCTVGEDAFIGPGAILGGEVMIGEGAFLGLGARILPGVSVGAKTVVGAGAVVVRDARAGVVVVGVPARERKGT